MSHGESSSEPIYLVEVRDEVGRRLNRTSQEGFQNTDRQNGPQQSGSLTDLEPLS